MVHGLLTPSGRASLIFAASRWALPAHAIMRLVRAEMLGSAGTDYIKFARARGLQQQGPSIWAMP